MEADSAAIVTVIATGADTTRPFGWEAVTVTYRGEECWCIQKERLKIH